MTSQPSQPSQPLQHKLSMGGTPFGFHFWRDFSECSRRAWLGLEARAQREPVTLLGDDPLSLGTVVHGMLREYHHGVLSQENLHTLEFLAEDDLPLEVDPACMTNGARLIAAHMREFPRDVFGDVVATEWDFGPCDATTFDAGVASTASELARVSGLPAFTGSIDAVVDCPGVDLMLYNGRATRPTKKNPEPPERERIPVSLPQGVLLIDWKTSGGVGANQDAYFTSSLQLAGYQLAWNALNPDRPCVGAIAVVIVKYKDPVFRIYQQDAITEDVRLFNAWQAFTQRCQLLLQSDALRDQVNPAACFPNPNGFGCRQRAPMGACLV